MQTGHPKVTNSTRQSRVHTPRDREMQMEQKVQGVSSYYLIAVHEEADDECAHARLIVDTSSYDTEVHS
jgi:hypothetical protein